MVRNPRALCERGTTNSPVEGLTLGSRVWTKGTSGLHSRVLLPVLWLDLWRVGSDWLCFRVSFSLKLGFLFESLDYGHGGG